MSVKRAYSETDRSVMVLITQLLKFIAPSFPKRGSFYLDSKAFDYTIRVAISGPRYIQTLRGAPSCY